jgi:hypothetical protein
MIYLFKKCLKETLPEKLCPDMSFFFLLISGMNLLALCILSIRLYSLFKVSGEQKILPFYREILHSAFSGVEKSGRYEGFLHLISIHLLAPLTGLAFFLRTDVNFLVFILSILWSMQLYQRLFPGMPPE